jgi:hypothetical protein
MGSIDKSATGSHPTVSVVMAVYNAERYVGAAIQSILSQSYRDFEFIVIDDGSKDRTLGIVEQFRKSDSRMSVVSGPNRGLSRALNDGIQRARGRWIARMDGDDVALPNRLESQLDWLERTKADVCGGWVEPFGFGPKRIWTYYVEDREIKQYLLFNSAFAHPTVVMRTEVAKCLPYEVLEGSGEDYGLWVRMASAGYRMTNIPQVVLRYRISGKQVSTAFRKEQMAARVKIANQYWGYFGCHLPIASFDRHSSLEETCAFLDSMDTLLRNSELRPGCEKVLMEIRLKTAFLNTHLGIGLFLEMRRRYRGRLSSGKLFLLGLLCAARIGRFPALRDYLYRFR